MGCVGSSCVLCALCKWFIRIDGIVLVAIVYCVHCVRSSCVVSRLCRRFMCIECVGCVLNAAKLN